ncbi:MAG: outer membrane protein transport protein [Candidatus Cloacimonetes bacterium]|nr:outer membrane protein transport protein [Candidatus Cloacimonadota bacterium]
MKLKFLYIFLILFVSSLTFAQIDLNLGPDWNFTGVGARAAGMGGAFIGVADDATAISWNPAGLTQLDEPEASVVARGLVEKYEVDFDYCIETYEDEHAILNFLSGVYPFEFSGKQFVAALAVQRQLDLYSYYHEEDLYEDAFESNEYICETLSEGGASTITLGLANRLASILSLGVAANLWVGEAYFESKDMVEIDSVGYYYYWDYYDRSDLTFSGVNFVCGAMLDFNYSSNPFPLKIGLVMKTPFDLTVDEEFLLEEYTDDNGSIYEPEPVESSDSYILGMPLMYGFGASYRFGDNLTLAVDMESRKYGETNLKEDYADLIGLDLEEEDELIIIENQDLNQFRFGGEYLFTELWDFAVIPLRIGIQTYPTLFMDNNDEQVVGAAFSLGTGLITDQYSLDISFKNTEFEIEYGESDDEGFIYTKTLNTLTLSCIYYF